MYYYKFLKRKTVVRKGQIVNYEINAKPVTLEIIKDEIGFNKYFTIPELIDVFNSLDMDITYQAAKSRVRGLVANGYLKTKRKKIKQSRRDIVKWYCLSKNAVEYINKNYTFLKGYLMKNLQ